MCGLLLKNCDVKFHKVLFNSVLFDLMFKIVQRLRQETVVLFAHKASKLREREHESRDGVRRSRHVDNYLYFPIVLNRSKGGGKKVIKGLKSGERKVDTSKPLLRPILISCKLSRIPCSVSKQRSNSQFTLICWSKEGIVWEWSGVKGYVEVCTVSACRHHLKIYVLVPMRHWRLDIPAI